MTREQKIEAARKAYAQSVHAMDDLFKIYKAAENSATDDPPPQMMRCKHWDICDHAGTCYHASDHPHQAGCSLGCAQMPKFDCIPWAPAIPEDGYWAKDDPRRIFVEGAKWWEFKKTGATMWQSDRNDAEAEAEKRHPKSTAIPEEILALRREFVAGERWGWAKAWCKADNPISTVEAEAVRRHPWPKEEAK
jgi:hypothetical protein